MDPIQKYVQTETRRQFFGNAAKGLGVAALSSLMGGQVGAADPARNPATGGLMDLPHYAPKAKRAIYLFMAGAPAQMDMLDYKPKVDGLFDKDLPESIRMGQRLTTMTSGQERFPLAPSKFQFKQ